MSCVVYSKRRAEKSAYIVKFIHSGNNAQQEICRVSYTAKGEQKYQPILSNSFTPVTTHSKRYVVCRIQQKTSRNISLILSNSFTPVTTHSKRYVVCRIQHNTSRNIILFCQIHAGRAEIPPKDVLLLVISESPVKKFQVCLYRKLNC